MDAFDTNCKTDLVVNKGQCGIPCGCRKWDLSGIPCNHAISAINKAKRFPEDYVCNFFKKPFYLAAYEPMIYPVPGEHDWTRTSGPDIEPPKFHVKKGRRKEKRIKGRFEVPKPKESSRMATITCSNCGLQGHRYTNCKQQLRPELALRKNKHVVNPCEFYLLIGLLSFYVFCAKPL